MKIDKIVLIDNATNQPVDVFMGVSTHHQMFFDSPAAARSSNCHGIYADKTKFRLARVKVELVEDDIDPPTESEIAAAQRKKEREQELAVEMARLGIVDPEAKMLFLINRDFDDFIMDKMMNEVGKLSPIANGQLKIGN